MKRDSYDVIIIGAGIGGLICGCYLSKEGFKVLIVEQHNKPGGCVTSVRRHDHIFDFGAHIIGSCGDKGLFNYYLKSLGVAVNFDRIAPTDRFIFPDRTIEVPLDIHEYKETLKSIFEHEAEKLDHFFAEMLRVSRGFASSCIINEYRNLTYERMLRKFFKDERLMSILSSQYRFIGVAPKNAAASSMCLMMASYLRDGAYYPVGGAQSLPDSIVYAYKKYGGEIVFKKMVKQIVVKNNKTTGIMINNQYVQGKYVVSNADAIKTFVELVGAQNLNRNFLTKLNTYTIGTSVFTVFLAVKTTLLDTVLRARGWHFNEYKINLDPHNALFIFSPNVIDTYKNTSRPLVIELALYISGFVCSRTNWIIDKKKWETSIISKAAKIIPDLSKYIITKDSASPETIKRFTLNTHGSMYGWAMKPSQIYDKRLSSTTPIENLFLAGHWTTPGCGVISVATSGWVLAKKILSNFRNVRRGRTCT